MSVDLSMAIHSAVGDSPVVGILLIGREWRITLVLADGGQGRRFELFIRGRRSRCEPVGIAVWYSGSAHDSVWPADSWRRVDRGT
jgi:hypothetical protein